MVPGYVSSRAKRLVAGWLLAGILVSGVLARAGEPQAQPAPPATDTAVVSEPAPPATDPSVVSRYTAARPISKTVASDREALMLRRRWGIDNLHVRSTASGEVVRFSYRVVDADKARALNDKKAKPYLLAKNTAVKLEVPTTEKVGQLRQTATPENGREYWMVFGNVGRIVKPGDHVDIVIGAFHANELVVESAEPMHRVQKP
jgi:hypothetical protein